MIEKNKEYILNIDSLDFEGKGVARTDNMVVFVPGALPGETAEVLIIKVASSYAVGKLLRITEPSPQRKNAECPYASKCGGCTMMHLDYKGQLEVKRKTVIDALERIGGIKAPQVETTVGMESPFRYRNKSQYPITPEGIGLYRTASHSVVELDDCLIGQEVDAEAVKVVRRYMSDFGVNAYNEKTGKGSLRHVIVKTAVGGMMVVLVSNTSSLPAEKELCRRLREIGARSVYLNVNRRRDNVILGAEVRRLDGDAFIQDETLGIRHRVYPLSFRQVNPEQTAKLYSMALEMAQIKDTDTVFDAYCGAGVLSLLAARRSKEVYGVEIVAEAIGAAKENAALNSVENVTFLCGECETVYPQLMEKGIKADVIMLDPPRKGCDEGLLVALAGLKTERIVYISCNPSTLARDLKILSANGYTLDKAIPVDMFPQTSHVETVALLRRK